MSQQGLYFELVESQERTSTQDDTLDVGNQNSTAVLTDEITYVSTNLNEESNGSSSTRSSLSKISISDMAFSSGNDENADISMWEILKMNKPEWVYILLGVVGAVILGLSTPFYAIVFGELMSLLDQSLNEDVNRLNNILALVS